MAVTTSTDIPDDGKDTGKANPVETTAEKIAKIKEKAALKKAIEAQQGDMPVGIPSPCQTPSCGPLISLLFLLLFLLL